MSFVVSRGSLTALEPRGAGASWFPPVQRGITVSAALTMTYGRLYRVQPAVRTVVSFLARNVAQLGIHTYRRAANDDRKRLRDHPLAMLLDDTPNSTTTPYRLIYSMIADRAIYDVAFWLKVRGESAGPNGGRGELLGLRRISPRRVSPLDGDWLDVDRYRITGTRGYVDVDRDDLVVFPGYDPEDESASGSSPIESLRLILAEEYSASQYREQLWRNGARAAGYLQRPADAPEWSGNARKRFRESWQSQYTGDGPNAGGTPILEDGMQWIAAGVSPKDAQYVESRMLTREETATAYHIPPPLVGLLEHATFSNIEEQHKQLYQDTLGPWTVSTEQEIHLQLAPEFPGRGVYVEFNYAEKLRGSFEEQAAGLQGAVGRPYMTPNEARARLNLSSIEGGDELLVPLNMGNAGGDPADAPPDTQKPDPNAGGDPAADPAAGGSSDPAPAGDPAPAKRRGVKARAGEARRAAHETMLRDTFERQQRSVLARAGAKARKADAVTTADLFDRARWDRELSADLRALAPAVVADAAAAALDAAGGPDLEFDPAQVEHFLDAQTARVAEQTNATTEQQIETAVQESDGDGAALQLALAALFLAAIAKRAPDGAQTQITALSGFGTVEAARQLAAANPDGSVTKKWITGENPRPTHAAMDGQTVAYDAKFSNGASWPADAALDVDEVAGCNCEIEIEFHE